MQKGPQLADVNFDCGTPSEMRPVITQSVLLYCSGGHSTLLPLYGNVKHLDRNLVAATLCDRAAAAAASAAASGTYVASVYGSVRVRRLWKRTFLCLV